MRKNCTGNLKFCFINLMLNQLSFGKNIKRTRVKNIPPKDLTISDFICTLAISKRFILFF